MAERKLAELWDSSDGLAFAYSLRVGGEMPRGAQRGRKVAEIWDTPDGYLLRCEVGRFQYATLGATDRHQAERAAEYEAVEALRKILDRSDRGALPVLNVGEITPDLRADYERVLEAARLIVASSDAGTQEYRGPGRR